MGNYTVPNVFANLGNTSDVGLIDANNNYITDGLNNAFQFGTLINRPAAGSNGAYYFATDVGSGTLYLDNGSTWLQVAASVGLGSLPIINNYLTGFILSNDGTSPNTVMDISSGQCTDSTNTVYLSQTTAWTKTTGAWNAGTGNGMLDTGTVAANTWYHIYAISLSGGSSPDFLMSVSATSPTMPGAYVLRRRIGSFRTNASSQIVAATWRADRSVTWFNSPQESSITNPGTATVTVSLGYCPTGIIARAWVSFNVQTSSATATTVFVGEAFQVTPPIVTSLIVANAAGSITQALSDVRLCTNSSAQIAYKASTSSASLVVTVYSNGYQDLSILSGV